MSSTGCQRRRISLHIHRLLRSQECGNRFEGHAEVNILSVGDAALYASAVVGQRRDGRAADESVVYLRAATVDSVEAVAILKTFDGIDAQHGGT